MNQAPVKLGPLALLLTVISICLTILSILTYTTAGADDRLAQRYAQTTTERYELEIMGQEALAEFPEGFGPPQSAAQTAPPEGEPSTDSLASPVGGGGPEGTGGGALWKTIEQGDLTLTIGAVEENGAPRVICWRMNRDWEQDTVMHNLWDGN